METKTRHVLSKIFRYKKKSVNYLSVCYLLSGGFWWETNVYYPMRIVYFVVNIVIFIYGFSGMPYIWITRLTRNPSLSVVLFDTQTPLVLICGVPGTYILTYTLRNKLKALFKVMDNDWNCAFLQNTHKTSVVGRLDEKRRQFKRNKLGYIIVQSIFAIFYWLSRPVAAFFIPVENLRESYFHFLVTPFGDNLDSLGEYLIIYSSQLFPSIYITSLAIMLGLFVLLIAETYLEAYVLFAKYISMNSMSLAENIEKMCEKELIMCYRNGNEDTPQSESHDIHYQKQIWFELTSEKLIDYVQCHQYIYKSVEYFRFYLEIASLFATFIVFIFYTPGLLLIVGDSTIPLAVKTTLIGIGSITVGYMWACYTSAGTFEDLAEILTEQIYNMPWYYLPPKQRKEVYMLLMQSQLPISFCMLKLYPIVMARFLRVLNICYSIVSVVRSV